jgi:tetratricopeptide (TPR) repeat protein
MIKIKHPTLVLFLCLVVNFCFGQNYFEEGKKAYLADNNSKAIELLTKAILNNQEKAKSLMYRGAAKIFLNQYDDALADLELSKEFDSTFPRLYFYYGKLYLIGGKPDVAIQYYSRTIATNSRDDVALTASAYNERSTAKALTNDLKGALADANAAIAIDSTRENFYGDRGYTRILLKQYEAAIKDLNTSLKIEPNQKAYANRGLAWSLTNQHRKAIEDYTKALSFNPDDAEFLYLRGVSYIALSKKPEALADLKKSSLLGYTQSDSILKELGYSQTYYEEGNKEFDLANYSKSAELFTQAILNDQEIAKSLMMRGAAKLYLYQIEDAGTDLESSKQVDSTNSTLYFYFGKYYRLTSHYDLAVSSYSRVIDSNRRDHNSYYERSIAKEYTNDLEGALADANEAISIDSTSEDYYIQRGRVRMLLKQYPDAIKDLNTSLKIKPNPRAYANRGMTWSLTNQHQKAIEDFTRSIEIFPQFAEAYYYRGVSYKALSKRTEACADLKKSSELGYTQADAVLKELNCDQ